MKNSTINIHFTEFSSADELEIKYKHLIEKAKDAAQRAYAPYSSFFVGAAVMLANGEIVEGNNQENAAYPSGLCAERVALFYANSLYPNTSVQAIAICAFSNGKLTSEPVPPCGSCRQVLVESETRFNTPINIFLAGQNKIIKIESASELLPFNFNKEMLLK